MGLLSARAYRAISKRHFAADPKRSLRHRDQLMAIRQAVAEALEPRTLLSVSAEEYAAIRDTYADFLLPADMAGVNIIEITPGQLSVVNLKSAITSAAGTTLPDLVVVRTTDTQNTITYASPADELAINIPETQGATNIVGLGTRPLTLDGAQKSRLISVGSPSSTTMVNLGGLTLTNGVTTASGGGIIQLCGTLRLTNVRISGNSASSVGGGLYQYYGTSTLTNVTISGNTSNSGGGLYQYYGTSTLTNGTISGNTSSYGGGLYQSHGTSTLTNVVISGNTASGTQALGGGMFQGAGSTSTLTNATIAGNTVSGSSSYCGGVFQGGIMTLNNTIVARNTAGSVKDLGAGGTLSASNNLIGDGTGQTALINDVGGNLVGTAAGPIDPKFASMVGTDPTQWNLRLRSDSAAVNSGDNAWVPPNITTDIAGELRIVGATVDMGAYEYRSMYGSEYATIRNTYPDFALPADMSQVSIIEIMADQLSVANLKSAINAAAGTTLPDLVVVRTTDTQNTITYASLADSLAINIPATQGAISIVGFGSRPLTIDAAQKCSVIGVGSWGNSTTTVNLGGVTLQGGASTTPQLGPAGGVNLIYGTLRLENSTISGNTSSDLGGGASGGLFQWYGTLTLTNVVISGNTASGANVYGAGMYQGYGTSTLTNVVISGNTASGGQTSGGGMFQRSGSTSTLTNVTIAGNIASGSSSYGGGMTQGGTMTLKNTIIARNTSSVGPDLYSFHALLGSNSLIGNGTGQWALVNGVGGNLVGTGASPIDPQFVSMVGTDPTQWNLRLRSDSVAVNSGDNAWIPVGITTDIAGGPRIVGVAVDMGAYEYRPVYGSEYATIRNTYPDFALPSDMSQVNIIEITADQLSVANLKSAINAAAGTTLPDLVVVRTTDTQNTITYASLADSVSINIPATQGAISIVGFGSRPLTIDAAQKCSVIGVGMSSSTTTTVNLGGMTLTGGATTAAGSGPAGGVNLIYGTLRLENSTISGNTASDLGGGASGGLFQGYGTLTLTNVVISGNSAYGTVVLGGGMFQRSGSTSTLTNVTITGNTVSGSPSFGGGVYQGGIMTLNNTIVARNTADTGPDLVSAGGTLSGSNSLIGNGTGQWALVNGVSGNLVGTAASPIDPILAEDTRFGIAFSPLPGSPAIDVGDDGLIPSGVNTDIYGAARIQGARVNIGAVETVLPGMAGVTYSVTSLGDSVTADGVLTLREALAAANTNQAVGDAAAGSYSAADSIEFAAGLTGTILTHRQTYQITGSVDLVGPGASELTLDAGGSGGVLSIVGVYDVSVSGLTLTGGNAMNGGGIYSSGANLVLDDVVISGNTASSSGGGLYQTAGTATLTNVTIGGNWAHYGGGLYQRDGTSTLTNVTIGGNTAFYSGGGLYLDFGIADLRNSIVARNAAVAGPDLYRSGAGNIVFGDSNLIGDGAGQSLVNGASGNLVGTTASPIDPLFVSMVGTDPTQWNLRLGLNSPAANSGDNAWIPPGITTDIAGGPRILGTTVDMGAYEFNAGDANHDGKVDGLDLSLLGTNWQTTSAEGDLNGDGMVDGLDLSVLGARWQSHLVEALSVTAAEPVEPVVATEPPATVETIAPVALVTTTQTEALQPQTQPSPVVSPTPTYTPAITGSIVGGLAADTLYNSQSADLVAEEPQTSVPAVQASLVLVDPEEEPAMADDVSDALAAGTSPADEGVAFAGYAIYADSGNDPTSWDERDGIFENELDLLA